MTTKEIKDKNIKLASLQELADFLKMSLSGTKKIKKERRFLMRLGLYKLEKANLLYGAKR